MAHFTIIHYYYIITSARARMIRICGNKHFMLTNHANTNSYSNLTLTTFFQYSEPISLLFFKQGVIAL